MHVTFILGVTGTAIRVRYQRKLIPKLFLLNAICCSVELTPSLVTNNEITSFPGDPKAALLSHNNMVNNGYFIGIRNELDLDYKKICVQVIVYLTL